MCGFVGSTPAKVFECRRARQRGIVLESSGAADPISEDFLVEDSTGADPDRSPRSGTTGTPRSSWRCRVALFPSDATRCQWALRGAGGHKMTGTIRFTVAETPSSSTAFRGHRSVGPRGAGLRAIKVE